LSHLSPKKTNQKGFTLVEVLTVIVVTAIVGVIAFGFFNSIFDQYLNVQQDGVQFGDMALQAQRVSAVVRGLTGIISVSANDLQIYAYFSPNDTYVSQVHYYLNGSSLMADVTHMTANPPTGTLINSSKITYTVITKVYNISGVNIFDYLDASGATMTLPITDLNTIKGIRVNLSVPSSGPINNSYSTISSQVSLRNRKTNL
jgi:prepilin-type N-terminal cleavage/methylation domain-containing protein